MLYEVEFLQFLACSKIERSKIEVFEDWIKSLVLYINQSELNECWIGKPLVADRTTNCICNCDELRVLLE